MSVNDVLARREQWAVVHGDNLDLMRAMPARSVHLVYGDALYNTGDDFYLKDGRLAYTDKFASLDDYVTDLRERCAAARDVLTDDGTLVLQTDPTVSHYVKVMLDGVFGRECYRNEVVWRYRRWPAPSRDFQRMHDVLFRYVRNPKAAWRWHQLYEPLSPKTVAIHGTKKQKHAVTEKGRKWGDHAGYSTEESPGAYLSDVWEIGVIAPLSEQRMWPTQKPTELADRVVLSCSDPGDVVLDPWCGSGTHVSRAVAHGRRGVGFDKSPTAVEVATKRLRSETRQVDWLQEVACLPRTPAD